MNITTDADQTYREWMAATDRNLSLTAISDADLRTITIGVAEINLGDGNLSLRAGVHHYTHASGLTIRAGDFSHGGTFQTPDGALISTPLLVFADGNITLNTNFVLSNRLELRADADGDGMGMITASTPRVLAAGSVFLQQAVAFDADLFGDPATVSGAVTFRVTTAVDQVIQPWMAGLGGSTFSLRGLEGVVVGVVLNSITIPAAADFGTTAIDLQAATINLGAAAALTGGAISLTGEITAASSSNNNLTIIASGVLTLNDNINLGTGDLLINAAGGTTLGGVIELTAVSITLTGDITSANNNLTITAANVLSLNGDINTGTGDLTLDVGSSGGSFNGARTLRGNVVTITGAGIAADGDLTISALGNLMVNTTTLITVGANTLRLLAGRASGTDTSIAGQTGVISFGSAALVLQASRFVFTQDGELFVDGLPAVFQNADGNVLTLDDAELITRIVYDGTATQGEVDWANILPSTVSRGPGSTFAVAAADLTAGVLEAAVSITLDAGTGVLTFEGTDDITLRAPTITITAGTINLGANRNLTLTAAIGALTLNLNATATITGTGTTSITIDAGTNALIFGGTRPITVSAPTVTITAGDINIGTRALTITASNGALTVNADIRAAAASTGAIMLTATNGALTLGDDSQIVADAAVLTLSSTGTNSELVSCATCFLDAAELRLTQTTVFGGGELSPYILSSVSILNITTIAPQTVQGWMIASGRTFSLTTDGVLTLNNPFDASNNGDVTLTGMDSIVLGGTFTQISARNITLRGAISTDRPSVILTAEGVITIHNDIDAGTGTLTLTAGADISNGGAETAPTWTASAVSLSLTQGGVFGSTAPFTFDGTTLASLTIQTAAPQTAHSWMGVSGSDLSLTSTGGDITIGGAINVGTGNNLTLRARGNILAADTLSVLTADAVSLELTGTSSFGSGSRPFDRTSQIGTLNITTQADQAYRGWMAAIGRNLTIDSQGSISIGASNINLGTGGNLNLRTSGNILAPNTPRPVVTADTVDFELTGTGAFTSRLFDRASRIATLNITVAADQQYRGWMAGTNRNLSIDALGFIITINAAEINLGTGNLTLSARIHDYTHASGLTIRVGDFSHSGTFSTADIAVISTPLLVFADGNIMLETRFTLSNRLELRADADGDSMGMITASGSFRLDAGSLLLQHAGVFAADLFTTASVVSGAVQLRITAAGVDQPIHPWMMNLGDGGFRLQGAGVALTSITTEAALTRTGRIDLRATTITLGAALTGGEVRLRTNTITGDSANLVAIHATTGEIIATDIDTDTGRASTSRPALAAGVTSISLEQTSAFGGRGSLPFDFDDMAITEIALSTRSEQLVRNWMIREDRNLTITSSGRVLVEDPIGDSVTNRDIGAGALTLGSTGGGVVRIFENISTTGNLTLSSSGTGGINFNGGARILNGGTITLSGNARSNQDLTLNATTGALTLSGGINLTGTRTLSLSSMSDEITLGGALTLTGGSITFGNAVITGPADASLTITADTLMLNNDITLTGTSILDLGSRQGAITGSATLTLSATTTVRLRQADVFGMTPPPFDLSGIGSLELTTDAAQDVLNWMIEPNRNLTVTSEGNVVVRIAIGMDEMDRNLGTGNLTLTSTGADIRIEANIMTTGAITLDSATGIDTSGGARTLSGEGIMLNGAVTSIGADVSINANSGILGLNGDVNTRDNVTNPGTNTFGDLTLEGATIQIGRRGTDTGILLRGEDIALTSASGILLGRFDGNGAFSMINTRVANLTVNAQGTSTIAADITVADDARSGGDIEIRGRREDAMAMITPIAFTDARTITGRAIRLRGAAMGTADLTITASGTLRIENDINIGENALTLRSGVGAIIVGTERSTLTASTVSFRQVAAFARRPFDFDFGSSTAGSLELTTDAEQIVRDWMIAPGRNLTVTSARNVRVEDAIGSGDRDLGAGNLTLTSTGRVVRILADISTMGDLTLDASTVVNFNGGARILNGAAITLTGNAQNNNNDLTIMATGVLTINNNIDIGTGTSALSLSSGSGGIALDGTLTLTGGSITISNTVTGAADANLTITASSALTLNSDIVLTGTSILSLRSRQGDITGGTGTLTAPTVRLRQVDVFGGTQSPFDFGTTGSLELVTTATVNQDVLNWMIEPNRNLTVTSARNVFVRSAIGASEMDRNLGTGNLTLISERRVRILEDIATTGNIILTGVASSTQPAIRFENGARVVMGGSVRLNGSAGVLTSGSSVTLTATATDGILTLTGSVNTRFTAADGTNTFGDLTLMGATIQIARVASAPVNTRIVLRGRNITLTSAMGIQIGRFNRVGDFLRNNDVASLTVNAQSALTIAADITAADDTRSGGDIRLRGAATGTADLTITASGTLMIENDINIGENALTLTSGAGAIIVATERSTLTASTVSFRQVAAFAGRPFDFDFGSTAGSLEITTDAEQDVRGWMILEDTNLTVTSARNVRVEAAIGAGVNNRDLGAGNLTLTSTGRVVRILADISTGGDITLSGGTGGINFNGGARILNGAIITLTGAARSNRDLTITATGVLTINNNINIGTGALSLTGSPLADTGVDLRAGSYSFGDGRICDGSTTPGCAATP